jgi:hypothetical protein
MIAYQSGSFARYFEANPYAQHAGIIKKQLRKINKWKI